MWKVTVQGITFHEGELIEVLKVAEGLRNNFLMEVKLEMIEPMEDDDEE